MSPLSPVSREKLWSHFDRIANNKNRGLVKHRIFIAYSHWALDSVRFSSGTSVKRRTISPTAVYRDFTSNVLLRKPRSRGCKLGHHMFPPGNVGPYSTRIKLLFSLMEELSYVLTKDFVSSVHVCFFLTWWVVLFPPFDLKISFRFPGFPK